VTTPTYGVKLDDETRDRLKSLGEAKERSPHWLMKTAIREYLDREGAFEREKQEDRERWERYTRTGAFIDNDSMINPQAIVVIRVWHSRERRL
jgi:predicted transcriptional regulator